MNYASSLILAALRSVVVVALISCSERNAESHTVAAAAQSNAGSRLDTFEVLEISPFPDPATSDYPDCLRTARLRRLDAGEPSAVDAQIIMGAVPAFMNRSLAPGGRLEAGSRFKAQATAFDDADGRFRRMQMADSIGDYLLELHLIENVAAVVAPSAVPPAPPVASGGVRAPFPPEAYRRPHSVAGGDSHRQARIDAEINRIRELLSAGGGSWSAWMERLDPHHRSLIRQGMDADYALLRGQTFYSRLSDFIYEEIVEDELHEGPTGALLLLNAELNRRGIDLVVVPYPTKEDVHAWRFLEGFPAAGEINPQRLRFHLRLLENNVEVLDITPRLREAVARNEQVFFNNRDMHPVGRGLEVAAQCILPVLKDYGLLRDGTPLLPVEPMWFEVTPGTPHFQPGTRFPAAQVLYPLQPEVPDPIRRRVLFQGDSFLNVPAKYVPNATITDQVGRHLGFKPRTVLREGGANLILQDLARTPAEVLEGCEVLVFVFGPTRLRSPRSSLYRPEHQWHQALLPGGES